MKNQKSIMLILLLVILIAGCSQETTNTIYVNDTLGISLEYPDHWLLSEEDDNHLNLEYKEDESTVSGVYIVVDSAISIENETPLQILEKQMDVWRTNYGFENFKVVEEPQTEMFKDYDAAISSASVTINSNISGFSDSLILPNRFYLESIVISNEGTTATIATLTRGNKPSSELSREINSILESFSFIE